MHLLIFLIANAVSAEPAANVENQALAATLRIEGTDPKGNPVAGSGVAIAQKDGYTYALTAQHVVDKLRRMDVLAKSGKKVVRFPIVEVLARSVEPDLALIRFASKDAAIHCISLAGPSPKLREFPLAVMSSGWQEAERPTTIAEEAVARKLVRRPDGGSAFYWQTSKESDLGRSGGPLITDSGELIGICSGNQGKLGYFTHRDEIHYFLRKQSSWSWLALKGAQP